ncbi:hypothetical protein DL96DRAFT_1818183 [Flagelloscypha sp. PMI_526]|nr:hypothetical protein DL96DRAFT_1818183 [Flagelloscypha sp. PMI_526]
MNLPTYPEPPSYSLRPSRGEERLLINTRAPAPIGSFIRQSTTFTLVLYGQEPGTPRPCYGRSDLIAGSLKIKQTKNISSVSLKFSGVLEAIGAEGRRVHETILEEQLVLWSRAEADNILGLEQGTLPFSLTLPAEYALGTAEPRQLPPSLTFHDITITACIHYSIEAKVIRQRKLSNILGSSEESLFIEMEYRPRSRPARPLTNIPLLPSIQQVPAIWHRARGKLANFNNGDPQIICEFFLPECQVFGLSDLIPFHVQLSSTENVLADFVSPSPISRKAHRGGSPVVKVELLRQILTTDSDGYRSWTFLSLGDGHMSQLSPHEAEQPETPASQNNFHLHWQGSVKCHSDVQVPSFSVRSLVFKDFLVLYIVPGKKGCRFHPFKLPISITFVSDSWGAALSLLGMVAGNSSFACYNHHIYS